MRARAVASPAGRQLLLAAIGALALAVAVAGCNDRASGRTSTAPPPVPVVVADALEKVVPIQVTAVGNVQALTTVGVKSQISGQILQVHFREGQDVRRGDLLFTIDPRPLEAALRQAEANVARDTATLRQAEAALVQRGAEVKQAEANLARDLAQQANARAQEARYAELLNRELIAREQYDQIRTNMASMDATVQADRAAVDNAKASLAAARATVENARASIQAGEAAVEAARLQLGYTVIRSPIDGRTGNLLIQVGNIAKANDDTPMVVINQVQPIYLSFAVPERHLDDIARFRAAGPLRVEAREPSGQVVIARGQLTFVNNAVDAQTGTIQLKATFPNADRALWPGQFLEASLTLTDRRALVVPSQSIQPGQAGPYVFVVKADETVEARPVQPGPRLGAITIVEKGLAPGERVVTDGQLRLVPGARVEVKPARS
jgi:multidrug efflux system membrane fusion protein